MCICIKQGERASRKYRHRHHSGFTLPEVLVSLVICMLLMQLLGQWGILTTESNQRMQENQQALLLAQSALTGSEVVCPNGWEVIVEKNLIGDAEKIERGTLREWEITVKHGNQAWQFYYVGE